MPIKLEMPANWDSLADLPQPAYGWTDAECHLVEVWLERFWKNGWLPDKASTRMKQLLVFEIVVQVRHEREKVAVLQ